MFAAIDLGSNSFHLIVAELKNDQLLIIDRMKEMVRLASGLNDKGELSEEAQQKGLDCLARFGQRLKNVPAQNIRIVGTNTLRKAKNGACFIEKAEASLNHPIEVIAGREEARLIYLGVAHSQSENTENRLVIDIGGGSTEFIIGKGFSPSYTESLHMGCVSMTLKAFSDSKLSETNFKIAELYSRLELQTIKNTYRNVGWSFATGASGTIKAIGKVLRAYHDSQETTDPFPGITIKGLKWLIKEMIKQKHISKLELDGLNIERQAIFCGGVAVLYGAFKVLKIESMNVSDSALREGVIYDLQGRLSHEDVRQRTINHLLKQYHVDTRQAREVENTLLNLYQQVQKEWSIQQFASEQTLQWVALLHEIGLSIAHNQYHKHGAYIIENSDLPGFSRQEQHRLALLISAQRRKFPRQNFKTLSADCIESISYLAILLRLSILLHRDRSENALPEIKAMAKDQNITLQFPDDFLNKHPLTLVDLQQEADYLKTIKFTLEFN
ncbi:MAG: exopolyphosphatase [gamma proteobacterium symbiont of Bathyaustriella thionipta]|nr:exopolyphosphatase [gamma proteobacterium symbiont of Bathyaustriella thionipta]MCU7951179.1 exopolyphosphatase [gamma proteobacterium symbiont of Bathyaustriella thionipta]MCU7953984.1 exopolyphosphatase [gamma proteobacterium symbiont of Bathyaustriella thionipta]MCU7957685.1 exopolyphosphatase [gamma proteobacterium symbiont of Bathyaustriella thionipta]